MIHDHHPDRNHEAVSEAARLAAVIVTVVETMILVATKDPGRTQRQAQRDARVLEETRAKDERDFAKARDPQWVESASGTDLLKTWSAAAGWRELDTGAADAADRVEERLAALYPEAMHRYRDGLESGEDPSVAMARAAQLLESMPLPTTAASPTADHRIEPSARAPKPGIVINVAGARRTAAAVHRRQAPAPARRR
jgi:hypothetical protein